MAFLVGETARNTATVRTKNTKPPNVTNVTVINMCRLRVAPTPVVDV